MDEEAERLVVQVAKENPGWGYDRIVGALANLGYLLSDQTVGNIVRRHGLSPAPKRKQAICWKDFIRSHMEEGEELPNFPKRKSSNDAASRSVGKEARYLSKLRRPLSMFRTRDLHRGQGGECGVDEALRYSCGAGY